MKNLLIALVFVGLFLWAIFSSYHNGYMQGRHDGWWSRDRGGCMYDTPPCNLITNK